MFDQDALTTGYSVSAISRHFLKLSDIYSPTLLYTADLCLTTWLWRQKNSAESTFGAGEILLTSMDCDGTKDGYDIELTRLIADNVSVPVIASGDVYKRQGVYNTHEGLLCLYY